MYYFNKYHIPIASEAIATLHGEMKRIKCKWSSCDPPLFSQISIETYNRCNNDCSFCPANRNFDKRKPVHMKEEMFSKIISELKQLDFGGTVALHINNEPLLDPRLPHFVSETRNLLPDVGISIWTNGILLDESMLDELYQHGLCGNAVLLVDDYSYDMRMSPNLSELVEKIHGTQIERDLRIIVWIRDKNARLTRRAGNAPNRRGQNMSKVEEKMILRRWCSYPFTQLNVNPSGLVHVCCNDVYYENIVGDLSKESLLEVWRGERLRRIREELDNNGRRNINPCRNCDTINSWGIRS